MSKGIKDNYLNMFETEDPIYQTDVLRYGLYLIWELKEKTGKKVKGKLKHMVCFTPEDVTIRFLESMGYYYYIKLDLIPKTFDEFIEWETQKNRNDKLNDLLDE